MNVFDDRELRDWRVRVRVRVTAMTGASVELEIFVVARDQRDIERQFIQAAKRSGATQYRAPGGRTEAVSACAGGPFISTPDRWHKNVDSVPWMGKAAR